MMLSKALNYKDQCYEKVLPEGEGAVNIVI